MTSIVARARRGGGAWEFALRLLLFWLLFFGVFRVWFIVWFINEWPADQPASAWKSLWNALPLDWSMAGYLVVLPVLLWYAALLGSANLRRMLFHLIAAYHLLLLIVFVFVFGANVFLYENWHTPLNNRALEYFKTPAALLDSMSSVFTVVSVGLYGAMIWAWWRVYYRVVGVARPEMDGSRWQVLWLPFQLTLLGLAIRGGLDIMPINESAVYQSPHAFNNHAATNTAWHLIHSLIETRSTENHYRFLPDDEAVFRQSCLVGNCSTGLDVRNDLGPVIADTTRLNLVFIIMESMTAQVVEELGGEKGVCPNLSQLIRNGILFENCYGSGYRTDQGIVSVLGGYPAQPDQSIVLLSDKAEKLNSVPRLLHEHGYSTAFFYGGVLTFANIGVWLRNQRVDKIISEDDFVRAEKTQRWGVDDLALLLRAEREISRLKPPFCAAAMTLSLHPPYDVPFKSRWRGSGNREGFLNSAAFADHAIGVFFEKAEKELWFPNTLFVLVADHGASSPGEVRMDDPRSRHIPFIIYGEPLSMKWRGKRMDLFCNHHDIPATVMHLLRREHPRDSFRWSRNLWDFDAQLNGYPSATNERFNFAYYTNENGIGWLNKQGAGFFQFENRSWQMFQGELDSLSRRDAQAYLQVLYDHFLGL